MKLTDKKGILITAETISPTIINLVGPDCKDDNIIKIIIDDTVFVLTVKELKTALNDKIEY